MGITKTDFMRGMQCQKMLWLDKHKPKLKVIPLEVQARLDAGNDFGDKAMGMFGKYEDMTVLRPGTNYSDTKSMVANTLRHLELGTSVLCEAAFSYYNNYCAVDILRKTDTGYNFYEVKNAPEVHDQFVKDCGFQYYIISKCNIHIDNVFVVTHGDDPDNPFVINDVTDRAKDLYKWVDDNIWNLNKMQKKLKEVNVPVGDQCCDPYECWYYAYCHGKT